MAKRKKKKRDELSKPRMAQPKTGDDTAADIEKVLARTKNTGPKKSVAHLKRQQTRAAAEGVFQWRSFDLNPVESARHVAALARDLRSIRKPFEPLLVFPAGDRYYVIDGHHRLAAYEAVNWKDPVPVTMFEGGFDDARLRGLLSNNKNKLPMTAVEKTNAAWRLVKDERHSKADIVDTGTASRATVATMRAKWLLIKEADPDGTRRLRQMNWLQARRWTPGGEDEAGGEDWQEKAARALADRMVATGIAKELSKMPDVAALALSMINEHLPAALVREWGPEVSDWAQERYHEDPQEEIVF
jgi:ParB-like chromosome segregation protein Spo0J